VGRAGPANLAVALVLGLLAVWLGRELGVAVFQAPANVNGGWVGERSRPRR